MTEEGMIGVRCLDEARPAEVRDHPTLNGIDYVEYGEDRTTDPAAHWLVVTFLKAPPGDLLGNPEAFHITGGARVVGIEATGVEGAGPGNDLGPNQLKVTLSASGDFSSYTLAVDSPGLDPLLSTSPFGFKTSCPSGFDCRHEPRCPPARFEAPVLDYLAKDFASFRRLLLDLIPTRHPGWLARNPADLGMALVELLAYAGDHLSYLQDAVATEAYVDTARLRVSARRHARLVDYRMHDGRNALTFVQLDVASAGVVPQETMLLTRISRPLPGQAAPPPPVMVADDLPERFEEEPALRDVVAFETTARVRTDPLKNRLYVHTWGNLQCCIPEGATEAHLFSVESGTAEAVRPPLEPGDYVLFEEVRSPVTGDPGLADPGHRQVVRLLTVEDDEDLVHRAAVTLDPDQHPILQPVTDPAQPVLPLVKVTLLVPLRFPICISARHPQLGSIAPVSLVRGNVLPCDQGRTVEESLPPPAFVRNRAGLAELRLSQAPLTFQGMPPDPTYDERGRLHEGRHALGLPATEAQPAVTLLMEFEGGERERWVPVPDLIDSHAFDEHFVAEVENGGEATLRFGDGEYGRRPVGVTGVKARYRVGNGPGGNVGRGSLAHIVQPRAADMTDPADPAAPPPAWPNVETIRHPLPASKGTAPQPIEEVRQLAPRAFRVEQFRAVSESDYELAALKLPAVAAAKCSFRWTGSWHTVFVGIHPRDSRDLHTEAGGRTRLTEEARHRILAHLTRYKLAGYDLEVRTAWYVPLEIAIRVCVAPGHFRGDVLGEVDRALGNELLDDGTPGFFHPSRFAFGEAVYLSQVYAAVERIEGVDSLDVTVFKRYWELPGTELEDGVIDMGSWEIARLDDDPNFPENGVLHLSAVGGM